MYISIVDVNKLKYFIPESIPYFELSILQKTYLKNPA